MEGIYSSMGHTFFLMGLENSHRLCGDYHLQIEHAEDNDGDEESRRRRQDGRRCLAIHDREESGLKKQTVLLLDSGFIEVLSASLAALKTEAGMDSEWEETSR